MGVNFLRIKEHSGERSREVKGGIGIIICSANERIREFGWREGGGEEGFVVNVGGVLLFCGHRHELL